MKAILILLVGMIALTPPYVPQNETQYRSQEESPLPVTGRAMYQNPGIADRTHKLMSQWYDIPECPECIGKIAMARPSDIGRTICIMRPAKRAEALSSLPNNLVFEGPFLTVDVAALRDLPHLRQRQWVVDVDYKTAQRWEMAHYAPLWVTLTECPEWMISNSKK